MKYTIGWLDATAVENWENEDEFIEAYASEGIAIDIENITDDWYEFSAWHEFEAKNDTVAIEKTRKFFADYHRNVDVFSLRQNQRTVATEEDIYAND